MKDDNIPEDELTYDDKVLILQMLEQQYAEAEEMYHYLHSMHNFSINSNLENILEYQRFIVLGTKKQYFEYEDLMLLDNQEAQSYHWKYTKE